jgi:hypothetical protein
MACCVLGCGLELGGLEAPDGSSLPPATLPSDAGASVLGSAADASGVGPRPPDAAVNPSDDGAPPSAVVDGDAPDAAPPPEGADAGDNCDLDVDGFKSAFKEGCNGTDCCDNDARSYPGQAAFFTTPDACGSFDYDCSGVAEPQFGKVSCTLGVLACSGSGFEQVAVACGVVATFDACNLGIGCYTTPSQQTQSCH